MRDFARAHEDDAIGGKGSAIERAAEQDAITRREVVDGDGLRFAEVFSAGSDFADGGVRVEGDGKGLALVGLDLQGRQGGLYGPEDAGLLREGAYSN